MRPGAKTLIIGPGGGWDVARALASGSNDITAVEINPIIAETIMQRAVPAASATICISRPDVHVHVEDGRSFVRRSTDKYQVMQATLVDTWASTAAGAFALSENNLYTTDAFHDYLTHLTDDGMIAFTPLGLRAAARIAAPDLAGDGSAGATGRDGAVASHHRRPRRRHRRAGARTDTVLISRKPFTAGGYRARARRSSQAAGCKAVYLPGEPTSAISFTICCTVPDPDEYQRNYTFDISPVSDNRPFFFYTVQPRDLWDFVKTAVAARAPTTRSTGRAAAVRADGNQPAGHRR